MHVALFTGPTQTCFPAGDVTPVYGVTLALFYPIRTQFHATCSNLMCSKTCFLVGGQTRQLAYKLVFETSCTVFVARFPPALDMVSY